MLLTFLPLVALIGLALYVFREGRDRVVHGNQHARWILIAALIPLAGFIAFSVFMGVGEMLGDVPGGIGHLVPIIPIVVLGWIVWERPVAGGITMLVLGVVLAATFFTIMNGDLAFKVQAATITGVPFALCGLLAVTSAFVARRAHDLPHGAG